ncbi:MAG: hypothetical protein IJC46_04690 [Clostridia bacterium]|nr:hypothetical protein [Clostridia bacterium]
MNFKRILAVVLVMVMLVALAGCNFVNRPKGAVNNGLDISGKLADLLKENTYKYEGIPEDMVDKEYYDPSLDNTQDDEGDNGDDEPEPEPDPVYTPFTSTYDAVALLTKINSLMTANQEANGIANSATGVSDELLNGRTVKIMVPDDFPIEDENAAVEAMVAQYGCSVNVRRCGTGSAYTAACRKAVLSGDSVDLMYVDNSVWGDVHAYTQPINSFVNFELGDELGTFSTALSHKFYVQDALDESTINYYVAAGIGAPYLLAYNTDSIEAATLAASKETVNNEVVEYREIAVTDPIAMYNNGTWGIKAFNEMLKASTKGTNVGIASEIDALEGLDIWYGMSDTAGFLIDSTTGKANINLPTTVNDGVNMVQDWYWNTKGVDSKNFVGAFVDAADYEDGTVYEKLFNYYSGSDTVKSYSFVGCEPSDIVTIKDYAKLTGGSWDFVGYPYAQTQEDAYRAMDEATFNDTLTADKEGAEDPAYVKQIKTPVAGWVGGFAVMKTCQNPSVALRVAEEYTKIWQNENEDAWIAEMTAEQQERYLDMKENIGVSFIRGWAEKAADVNAAYPNFSAYIYSANNGNAGLGGITTPNPNNYTNERSNYISLILFNDRADLVVAPMYHKNAIDSVYNPSIQTTWSGWVDGAPSTSIEGVVESGSIVSILNTCLLPATILFNF